MLLGLHAGKKPASVALESGVSLATIYNIANGYKQPKHGSWLNMAEIKFSALLEQCLDRGIGSIEELDKEVQAWIKERNEKKRSRSTGYLIHYRRKSSSRGITLKLVPKMILFSISTTKVTIH